MRLWMISMGLLAWGTAAVAQTAPKRQVPPPVLVEVAQLENRFEEALLADCNAEQCFSKGCSYVDHAVADRKRTASLPGLSADPITTDAGGSQAFLTAAECGFAYESTIEAGDAQALARRLETKLSGGWTVVAVSGKALRAVPDYLLEPPGAEEGIDATEEEPLPEEPLSPEWSLSQALLDLWFELLPHAFWMVGVLLVTLAGLTLIWGWRKLGALSVEDQLLLAEINAGGGAPPDVPASDVGEGPSWVEEQRQAWSRRLAGNDPEAPDPQLQSLIRELLRAGELSVLAKAAMTFPEDLPGVFPEGGELAAQKVALARFVRETDPAMLPADEEFYAALNRHALSAAVLAQPDAGVVQSLREEFGTAGLAGLVSAVPARPGALLFALAPRDAQHEAARLMQGSQLESMARQLLWSNRMDSSESEYLFDVVRAVRQGRELPVAPVLGEVSDRGAVTDAVGALGVLLPLLSEPTRAGLFGAVQTRRGGRLPQWHREIFLVDMLGVLPEEARVDLLLEVDATALSAWLSLVEASKRQALVASLPSSLQNTLAASADLAAGGRRYALADEAGRDLSRAFQRQLGRAGLTFEQVVTQGASQQ